eukprot:TRINITY_DN32705_c0_g1_i1.p1 TRINITY_DN32705_c0_g1~~TRINITY_DN32705_c0_g1_i1.p1  ORF type:complete len:219 (-),score=25.87 TRINITY_DN32705_c0_g1_i1:375-1031(-)
METEASFDLSMVPAKCGEVTTPTASTMTFQGRGCADHLCQKRECGECGDDRFKPLLELGFLDNYDVVMLARLRKLDWEPENGNPVDYFDRYGDSLLHSASRSGDALVVEKLLQLGADANVCCRGHCCCSPLMVACRWCRTDCACKLLDYGADAKKENRFGESALDQVLNKAIGTKRDKESMLVVLRERGLLGRMSLLPNCVRIPLDVLVKTVPALRRG